MRQLSQSPTDPEFVQKPYPFYDQARAHGPIVFWEDYGLPAVVDYDAVNALLRDTRLGREIPQRPERPDHLRDFYAIDDNSMLELEPPQHTSLRKSVLRAFTSRRIAGLGPEIETLCHALVDAFPTGDFDLLDHYARHVPVLVIARLLGVPDAYAPQLLAWSNDMVAMYQARRDRALEDAANTAAREFADFLRGLIADKRTAPKDDLISELVQAQSNGTGLSDAEVVATCVLLLNAGHEATVHTLGNGIPALLSLENPASVLHPNAIDQTIEEVLRYDPPLHMFTRFIYEPVTVGTTELAAGGQLALMLGAAARDPKRWDNPHRFDPTRPIQTNPAFGAGRHFCLGAPLARLELKIALPILFERCPKLKLTDTPRYANLYHFHGLERLDVTVS